jgi:hypothetical protein
MAGRIRIPAGVSLAVAVGITGCAPPAVVPEPVAPPALVYGLPAIDQALYSVSDTATFRVDSGEMGVMTVTAAFAGTAHMHMDADGDTIEAVVRYLSFRGSFESPPHPAQQVDESHIRGTFTARVGPRGGFVLTDSAELSPALLDVAGPESLIRPLFVHLPARPVASGDAWVDTVSSVEQGQDTETRARSIITTTLAGDTVVGDRPLLLLHTRAQTEIEVTGRSGGVQVHQLLTGVTTGTVIWDDRLNLLVERREEGQLTGTLGVRGEAGTVIPLAATVRRTVELVR